MFPQMLDTKSLRSLALVETVRKKTLLQQTAWEETRSQSSIRTDESSVASLFS